MCRSYSNDRGLTWTHPVHTQFHGGEPGMGILPDGAILCTQTGGWKINVKISEDGWPKWEAQRPQCKLVYEVSYDNGLTWSYWGNLYVAEAGSMEHMGSPIVRSLDEDNAIVVYHRGAKRNLQKHPHSDRRGPRFIGASWLRKVPADDPKAAGLRYECPQE